jgi:hypothetical protein
MQELNNAITERMNHMVDSGKIQELIDNQLESSVKGILDSSLREYSEFGKAVKAKLETSLSNAIEKVSFPEYSHFINNQVLALVEQKLNEAAVENLEENLEQILQPVPKQIKPGEFLGEVGRYFDHESEGVEFEDGPYLPIEWNERNDTVIELIVKDHFKVTFFDHSNKNEWYIGYIEDDSGRHITADLGGATHTYGVVGYLYKLYCTGTRFPDLHKITHKDYISVD